MSSEILKMATEIVVSHASLSELSTEQLVNEINATNFSALTEWKPACPYLSIRMRFKGSILGVNLINSIPRTSKTSLASPTRL
jgi:hypothetical protein